VDLTRGRLTDLPEEVVRGDFRLSPPRIKNLTAEAAPDGKTLVRAQFAPDRRLTRVLTLEGRQATISFRDDGSGGDDRAGDGSYAAILPVPYAEVRDGQSKLVDALRRRGITDIPVFDGRTQVGRRTFEAGADKTGKFEIVPAAALAKLLKPARTLLITDPGVVGDPARTFDPCDKHSTGTPGGVWTFGHLMTEMANKPATGLDPEKMARAWFVPWLQSAHVEDPSFQWPSSVDLAHAPFRLIAIVNRPDLATNLSGYFGASSGNGGELRFVFQLCMHPIATAIVEYGVPAQTCGQVRDWARDWIVLNGLKPGSAAYDAGLEALTEAVVRRGAAPAKPNGSALNQLRTDVFLDADAGLPGEGEKWSLQEWHIQGANQGPTLATVAQTPLPGFNGKAELASWINLEQVAILDGTHIVGQFFTPIHPNEPFVAQNAESDIVTTPEGVVETVSHWHAPGIASNDAREKFSLATCNGCHTGETGTHFRHLGLGIPPSGFLTGIDVPDPEHPKTIRHFDDLARRAVALANLASGFCLDANPPALAVVPPPFDPGIVELGRVLAPLPPITFTPTITSD
jgi:hypothetical protein